MQIIIDIVRGVCVLASENIELKNIGSFTAPVEEPRGAGIRGDVRSIHQEEGIETAMSGMGFH
jgi:hypothetical protein